MNPKPLYRKIVRSKALGNVDLWAIHITVVCLIGFLLRCLHVHTAVFGPIADMDAYLRYASEFSHPTENRLYTTLFPPGYSFFLAGTSLISQIENIRFIQYLQAIIDSCSILIIANITRILFSKQAGLAAAILYAFYRNSILSSGILLSESIINTAVLSSVLLFLHAHTKRSWIYLLFCAAATAFAVHVRVNMAVLICIFSAFISLDRKCTRVEKSGVIQAVSFMLLSIALLVPWSLRNSQILNQPSFISSNGAINMLQGNNPFATGGWFTLNALPQDMRDKINGLRPPEVFNVESQLAIDFMKKHVAHEMLYLIPNKLRITFLEEQEFWPWDQDLPSNYGSHPFGPKISIPLVPFWLIFPIGLVGLVFTRSRYSSLFIPICCAALTAPLLLAHGNSRFHYPIDPFLIISAAALLTSLQVPILANRFKLVSTVVAGYIVLSTLVQQMRFGGSNYFKEKPVNGYYTAINQMVDDKLVIDTSSSPTEVVSFPLADLQVNPQRDSHLLMQWSLNVKTETNERGHRPNIKITFYDADGTTVTKPVHPTDLMPLDLAITKRVKGTFNYSRILLVPPIAKSLHMTYIQDYPATVTISDLSLRGRKF